MGDAFVERLFLTKPQLGGHNRHAYFFNAFLHDIKYFIPWLILFNDYVIALSASNLTFLTFKLKPSLKYARNASCSYTFSPVFIIFTTLFCAPCMIYFNKGCGGVCPKDLILRNAFVMEDKVFPRTVYASLPHQKIK